MVTVIGETSAGVAAVKAKVPVSGAFNTSGHLIVTFNDASTADFGPVTTGTTTQAGVLELATSALTITGTDTATAVTPKALADQQANIPGTKVQNMTAVVETATPSSYPTGVSIMTVTSWSLNAGNGTVLTFNSGSANCSQIFTSNVGSGAAPQTWFRTYNSGWTTWGSVNMIIPLTAGSYTESTAVSSYPVGDSRIYYTTANSGSWTFTGKAGEVWTYNDGATFARQTFTRTQGGTTNFQEQWVRTNDFTNGWTPWHQVEFKDAVAILSSATSAITGTTQTAVSGLAVAVEANATYILDCVLLIASTVATSATLANSWTGPSGATMNWGDTNSTSDYIGAIGTVASGDCTLNNASHLCAFKGVLKTSGTAGSLTPTVAVSTTTGAPSFQVATNSYVRLTRIA